MNRLALNDTHILNRELSEIYGGKEPPENIRLAIAKIIDTAASNLAARYRINEMLDFAEMSQKAKEHWGTPSLRDQFAMVALPAVIRGFDDHNPDAAIHENFATESYLIADAMIKAREALAKAGSQ